MAAAIVESLESVMDNKSKFSNYDFIPPTIRSRPNNRPRTRNPTQDGLVGIEPNPGPPRPVPSKAKRGGKNQTGGFSAVRQPGRQRTMLPGAIAPGAAMGAAAAVGSLRPSYSFLNRGTRKVLGVDAHIFTGTCAVMTLGTDATGVYKFYDAGGNAGNIMYLNPRICCQLANMGTPAGYCPIGVIAQAYRKFLFTKAKLIYTPVSASTSQNTRCFA